MLLTISDAYREKKLQGHEKDSLDMQYAILFSEMQKDLNESNSLTVEEWYKIIKLTPDLDVEQFNPRTILEIIEDNTTDVELKNIITEFRPKLSFVQATIHCRRW